MATGDVDDTTVATTGTGQRVGADDLIATRDNDRDADVANRDTWTVLAEHTSAAAAYVGMTRGRTANTVHLVAEDLDDARVQWIDAAGRGRPDLGIAAARQQTDRAASQCAASTPRRVTADDALIAQVLDHLRRAWTEQARAGEQLARLEPRLARAQADATRREQNERILVPLRGKPATAHQAHRTMRTALGEAVRRGYLSRNVAALAKPPSLSDQAEVEPYSVEEVKRLLETAGERRNSARWAIALALGLRLGEALGLKWSEVDLDAGTLRVRRGRQRPKYAHDCGNTCGRKQAGYCPSRIALRPVTAETKSRAGRRGVGLPDEIVALLHKHRIEQERERELAAQLWNDEDWLFATQIGRPVNPNSDHHEWKRLLV